MLRTMATVSSFRSGGVATAPPTSRRRSHCVSRSLLQIQAKKLNSPKQNPKESV
jgi:hypothetical protein